jgi:transcription elongation factor Elf1
MTGIHHTHWEIDSVCPKCGKLNHVKVPTGEKVVRIHCEHCTHGYDYIHMVKKPKVVDDDDPNGSQKS